MIGHFHSGINLVESFPYVSGKEMSHPRDVVSSEAPLSARGPGSRSKVTTQA